MRILIKPFSRGSSAIRLAYGKVEDGQFVPINDVYKAPNFKEFASRTTSGKYGASSYTEEYELDIEDKNSVFAVQKWHGITTTSPEKIWEIVYQPNKPGRPVEREGTYQRITLEVRSDLLKKIDASGKSRREYIEQLLES